MCTEEWHNKFAARALASALAAFLTACAGSLTDEELFLSSMTTEGDAGPDAVTTSGASDAGAACGDVPSVTFAPRCATAGCHGGSSPSAGLDMRSADLASRLVGKAAQGGPGVLIDPGGDPMKSVVYMKLTVNPPFGSRMPLTGLPLGSPQLECVAEWIHSVSDASAPGNVAPDAGDDASDATDGGALATDAPVHNDP